MAESGLKFRSMVLRKVGIAYDLSERLLREINVKSEIMISSIGKVTLRPTVSVTAKTHRFVAEIQQVLGVEFLKGRTGSNRCVYTGAKQGVAIRLRTDMPVCVKGEKKIETVPRSRSYFTCPVEA